MKGQIFDIQRFCLHDGPGVRTTVFFKGCPLRCAWCHNPESQQKASQLMVRDSLCSGCGACVAACPQRAHYLEGREHRLTRVRCTACGQCVDACPNGALKVAGCEITVEMAIQTALRDAPYYEATGGGITLSGGEPLAQPRFAAELLRQAKAAGLHACVETSGYCAQQALLDIARYTDLFLFDYKLTDAALLKQYTGADARAIDANFMALAGVGANIVLRCPIIPGINDNKAHIAGVAARASHSAVKKVELLCYHDYGKSKARSIGAAYTLTQPSIAEQDLERWKDRLRSLGCEKV